MHSLLVTCISPHHGRRIYSPHTPRLVCLTGLHLTLQSRKSNTTCTFQTAAAAPPRLGHFHSTKLLTLLHHIWGYKSNEQPHRNRTQLVSFSTGLRYYSTQPPTCLSSYAHPPSSAKGCLPPRHELAMPSPSKMRQQHIWHPPLEPALYQDLEK